MQKISIIIQPMSPINWALKTPQKGHLFLWSTSCSSILQLLKTFIFPPDFQAIFARFLYLHHDNLPLYFCDKSLNLVLWNRDANNSLNLLYFFFFCPLSQCCFWPSFYQTRILTNVIGFHLLLLSLKSHAFKFHLFFFHLLEPPCSHLIIFSYSNVITF